MHPGSELVAAELVGIANPAAQILCGAMMLRYTMGHEAAAKAIEDAVSQVLNDGLRTPDIARGGDAIGTQEMGAAVIERLSN